MSWNYYGFRPYVSVAERRRKAERETAKLAKKGKNIQPVRIEGRTLARTFWGKAWCDNLESYMDYENRLPRGRTYVRNGSVVHLDVRAGEIEALVSGSELYNIKITIASAPQTKWKALCGQCAGGIGSLVELLQGRFSDQVMSILSRPDTGLFPSPKEIKMKCSCPDWAGLCKHLAAVLYGVGARLDEKPELLFLLRSVNHEELLTQAAAATDLAAKTAVGETEIAESEMGAVFGIELDSQPATLENTPAKTQAQAPKPARSFAKSKRRTAAKTVAAPAPVVPAKGSKRRRKATGRNFTVSPGESPGGG
jgi:uncharacterized Zn finger protein